MKKKSVVFTTIAIMLVGAILITFAIEINYKYKKEMQVVEMKVDVMNNFIKDFRDDMERGVYIVGFRSILALDNYIVQNGLFIDDLSARFSEAMINGTINGNFSDLLNASSFADWTAKIKEQAGTIGININFTRQDVAIYQQNPWEIVVNINLTYTVTDWQKTAVWNKTESITAKIPVEGFEDPLYALASYGKVPNKIIRSNYTDFSDLNNLIIHLNNSYYIESTTAPSFLMRLEGNLSNSSQGIESLVNLDEFILQGIPQKSRSSVDYIYFGNDTINSCIVNETYSSYPWFRLDNDAEPNNHIDEYEVNCN